MNSDTTAPSSTPSREAGAVFSDEPPRASSPPSSPPGFPWERMQPKQETSSASAKVTSSSTPPPTKKNAFSILGKRKPLESIPDNVAPRPKKQTKAARNDGLTQMQMSLGQEVQKKCAQCGMEYTASSKEDRKLHDKFHKQNVEGFDVGKDFVNKAFKSKTCPRTFKGVKPGDAVLMVDWNDPWHRKRKGQAVLEIVQRELGAVEIPESDIWDMKGQIDGEPRYRSYLYVRGTKCVGFLLVQKIEEAFEVLQPKEPATKSSKGGAEPATTKMTALEALKARRSADEAALREADKQPIQLSTSKHEAILGVSRIWTSPTHRGQGIAICLLNTAVNNHNVWQAADAKSYQGLMDEAEANPAERERKKTVGNLSFGQYRRIERKGQVAFSQPTESGTKLARRWFGKPYGWRVYID